MSEYFSIGSHVIHDTDDVDIVLPLVLKSVDKYTPPSRLPEKRSLVEHYVWNVTYPTRKFIDLPHHRKLILLKKPRALFAFGIDTYLEIIGENYDYVMS